MTRPPVAFRWSSVNFGSSCAFPPGLCSWLNIPTSNMLGSFTPSALSSGPSFALPFAALAAGATAPFLDPAAGAEVEAPFGPKRSVKTCSTASLTSPCGAHRSLGSALSSPRVLPRAVQRPEAAMVEASTCERTMSTICSFVTLTPTPHSVLKASSRTGRAFSDWRYLAAATPIGSQPRESFSERARGTHHLAAQRKPACHRR